MTHYLYPQNLKASANMWFWSLKDFSILGIAALLVPTLLSLALAICLVSGGVLVLTAAFGGFAIFADLMVILGLAIILLALGLLLTWLFIWFIGGAIVGLIRGLCHLGGKWCYKEVPVQ